MAEESTALGGEGTGGTITHVLILYVKSIRV